GRRGVLLTGKAANVPGERPDGVIARDYAPFSLLLPRGAATVHHGGIGSTSQALRAGRPSVVVPHAHDQFNNAVHAVRLGVAAMVRRGRLDVDRLVRALRAVLDDPAVAARAATLGERLRSEPSGAEVAADLLEARARGAVTPPGAAPPTARVR
ncbi:MAG: glycosyltransferase, partial [Planctomycetota bacterium JB042]